MSAASPSDFHPRTPGYAFHMKAKLARSRLVLDQPERSFRATGTWTSRGDDNIIGLGMTSGFDKKGSGTMTPEEKHTAAQRLFSLLGLSGSKHFSVNKQTCREVSQLIIAFTPLIHGILWNSNIKEEHDRHEIANGVALRLLKMAAPTAAAVENGLAYLVQVVSSERNSYLRELIAHRNLRRGLAEGQPAAALEVAPTEVRPLTAGPGDRMAQRIDRNADDDHNDADGNEDPQWIGVHRRELISMIRECLTTNEFKMIMLKAEGYSYREIVSMVKGIPEWQVTQQQENASRQQLCSLFAKIRGFLADDNF